MHGNKNDECATDNHKGERRFCSLVTQKFDEMKELFIKKNEQYGTGDPLANFRTAALMHSGEASYEGDV